MKPEKWLKFITVGFVLLLVNGCATHRSLGEIPKSGTEFNLSSENLKRKYPEIEQYEQGYKNLGLFGYCTPFTQVLALLGEPEKVETVWFHLPALAVPIFFYDGITSGGLIGSVIVLGMVPKQPKQYYWRKGNYKIMAYADSSYICGYEQRLFFWKWSEISTSNAN